MSDTKHFDMEFLKSKLEEYLLLQSTYNDEWWTDERTLADGFINDFFNFIEKETK